jgi:hypothetical protein
MKGSFIHLRWMKEPFISSYGRFVTSSAAGMRVPV